MPITTYPYGANAFGSPQISASYQIPVTTGNYYYVSSVSGSNSNNGLSSSTPFATLKYAATRCLSNNFDVIIMMPGHTETVSAAAYITPVAGCTICGIGNGTLRPLLTWSVAAATIVASAANVTFQNFLCTSGFTGEVATMFTVSGTDCTFNGVDYYESSASCTLATFLTTTSGGSRLTIQNCFHTNTTVNTTSTVGWIHIVGGDSIRIWDNVMILNRKNAATTGIIVCLTTLTSNITILRNVLGSMTTGANNMCVSLLASSTGHVAYNCISNLGKTALAGSLSPANCMCTQNFVTHTVTTSGLLDPAVDS